MDEIKWQEYIEFEDTSYVATTSLVLDKKNGSLSKYTELYTYLDEYLRVSLL